MIQADLDEKNGLIVKNSKFPVTKEQEQRLVEAIKESVSEGWKVAKDHRFFLLTDFVSTNFKKTSPGGIFRVRFFNLEDVLSEVPDDIKIIAEQLKTKTWQ
ncbi:hypothetical protein [Mariniflexile maritimum]|uniref:hypothetical protein n=1 Tax=Mariniflexile maritimum TaxID=2682493 RepID=UPI0012F6AA67|nr:hypothetical protein [Mariniflexile maritimum]